jgi:FkbM family methyltransferase
MLRRRVPQLGRVAVGYDGNRSRIYADLGTPLGLQLYRYGHHDPDVELVSRMLSPGDVFVDGGANVGLFTLVAAERVGKLGKVLAFEPGRVVRLRLLENVVLNGFQQVVVMPFALSSQPGEARFRVFDGAGAGLNHLVSGPHADGDIETVACTTLDAAIVDGDRSRLQLIKLDLEGAEYAALSGAPDILRESRPDILLEVEPAHLRRMGSAPEAIADLLRRNGYTFYRVTSGGPGDVALQPVREIVTAGVSPNVFATVDATRASRRGISVS